MHWELALESSEGKKTTKSNQEWWRNENCSWWFLFLPWSKLSAHTLYLCYFYNLSGFTTEVPWKSSRILRNGKSTDPKLPGLTAMAKHDDHDMTWYYHGDSYSPWCDHGKIMALSSWDVAWSWYGCHGVMKNSKMVVRKVFWCALTYSILFLFSKEWIDLMTRVTLRTLFGTVFPQAVCWVRVYGLWWGFFNVSKKLINLLKKI